MRDRIAEIEKSVDEPDMAKQNTASAVEIAEDVLLQLTAVLERMLDLESYNEILDMFRQLIDDQQELLDETKAERKKRVLELFE